MAESDRKGMNVTTTAAPTTPSEELRKIFSHYPSGVAALAARVDGVDTVLVASSFTVGVSLEPALVMFAVQKSSTTWPLLRDVISIGVSVLSSDQDTLCRQLASKNKSVRWENAAVEYSESGALFIGGACVTLECSIYAEYPAGDHDIIVLQVSASRADANMDPLVFHGSRFRTMN